MYKEEIIRDLDGYVYHIVKIGNQEWMVENLKTTRYRNGDIIESTNSFNKSFLFKSKPKFQWSYDGDEKYVNVYGRLYTWHVATDSRGIAPKGWRVPSFSDWKNLETYLIKNGYSSHKGLDYFIAKSIASKENWKVDFDFPETLENIGKFSSNN